MEKAVILTDGFLDDSSAKTSHGLLRCSNRYDIVGVIDSKFAGRTTDEIVSHCKEVPVYGNIEAFKEDNDAEKLIIGVATIGGYLPSNFRRHISDAIKEGMDIVSGLHQYLSEDDEISGLAEEYGVELNDIRKSPPLEELHYFQNRKENMDTLTIPFLGTDSSIGKRTALIKTYEVLKDEGYNVCWIATGQTGLLQGADQGLPLDSIKGDYMVGELEYQIWKAWQEKKPDVILVEGQGSISHPAYVCGSRAVLSGSQPDGVVLIHAPGRAYRHYQEDEIHWPMPSVHHEKELIKLFSGADVIALGINPEGLSEEEKKEEVEGYEGKLGIPVGDPLVEPEKMAEAVEDMIEENE
ncbi:MAG: DUF1611 domain-containing protein [Thermoplasmatota archaeon]